MNLKQRLNWLFERKLIMLFLYEKRYLNPLISEEMNKLNSSDFLNDEIIFNVVEKFFPEFEKCLPAGMYFPVPISRSIKEGNDFTTELALKYHYKFIKIDENQRWSLQEKMISGKVLKLFQLNLFFEKETDLYFVEYWSDARWDKCYLECKITPMLAIGIINNQDGLKIQLNNQKIDNIDLNSFRIDKKERCFVKSKNFGEAMLSDAPRFWFLNNLDVTGTNFVYEKKLFSLNYSE